MKNKIYLVEQIWSDSMENKVEKALGYDIIGYHRIRSRGRRKRVL